MSVGHRWLLTLLLLQYFHRVNTCPSSCKCMWKGGKQTAECIDENLITIPDGIDQGTQVLEFSGNNLHMLPRERFQRMGLLNLQRIYLTRCRVSQIDNRAFRGLTNLVELDLSENLLNSVPTETFNDYHNLMRLTLNNNPIQMIKHGAFLHLSFLTTLEISNCQVEIIERDAFSGLGSLEWLKLDGNRLNTVRGSDTLPSSLHGIYLHNNPWQCNCRLTELHSWLVNHNVPHPVEPKCVAPTRLQGETIKSLALDDLACLPDVSPTTLYLEISEGNNLTLQCRVSAVPEARISWWFQGKILHNDSIVEPGLHFYYFLEEGTEEKRSELYIFNTNTEDNGTFVCVAENSAGKSHSNYTIRIVLREETVIPVAKFTYEYIATMIVTCSALVLFILISIVICVVRCRRNGKRRRKVERNKVVVSNDQHLHQDYSSEDSSNHTKRLSRDLQAGPAHLNGAVIMRDGSEMERVIPSSGVSPGVLVSESSGNPLLQRNHSVEQDPDLINGTESAGKDRRPSIRLLGAGEEHRDGNREAMQNITEGTHPVVPLIAKRRLVVPHSAIHISTLPREDSTSDRYQHQYSGDVYLSPGTFLDNNGCPVDYGLPKIPEHLPLHPPPLVVEPPAAYYRTLLHGRPSRLQTTATPSSSYSREAEFLTQSSQSVPYEQCSPSDFRYTAAGYPCSQTQTLQASNHLPSPPEPYKSEPTCNSTSRRNVIIQWQGRTRKYRVEDSVSVDQPLTSSTSCGAGSQIISDDNDDSVNNEARPGCQMNQQQPQQQEVGQLPGPTSTSPDEPLKDENLEGTDI